MPDKIVLGTPGMIPQGIVRTHSPRTGYTNILRWIGDKRFAAGIEQQLIAAGYETEMVEEGPNAIVTGTRSGIENPAQVEVPIDRWERRINRVEKSIYENFDLVSECKTAEVVGILKAQVEDRQFASADYPQGIGLDVSQISAWFELIMAGVESFVVFQPVVTKVQIVSNRYDKALISKANVGKILTYAQMVALPPVGEGAPAFVLDEKPAAPAGVFFSTRPGYFKNDPQFVPAADNKWEVTTEWELGYWASKVYSAAT